MRPYKTYEPITELRFKRHGEFAVTTAPFLFEFMGRVFRIESGYWFDGASIPRVLHWWEKPFAWWIVEGAAGHDYLYQHYAFRHNYILDKDGLRPLTRYEMDQCFLGGMIWTIRHSKKTKCRKYRLILRARTAYKAVRRLGWICIGDGLGDYADDLEEYIKQTEEGWA